MASEWDDNKIPNVAMTDSPSAVSAVNSGWANSGIYCFHQGYANCGELWYSKRLESSQPLSYEKDTKVPNMGLGCSPGAVWDGMNIFVFHQAANNTGDLWYNVLNANGNWAGNVKVPGSRMSGSPSVTIYNGLFYVFYRGAKDNGLCYNTYNNRQWSGEKKVSVALLTESPTAIVFNYKIYVFHQGVDNSGTLWWSEYDGTSWTDSARVPTSSGMSCSPSAFTLNTPGSPLVVLYQGQDNNGSLVMSLLKDGYWQTAVVGGITISRSPSATYGGDHPDGYKLLVYHQGPKLNSELWVKTLLIPGG